MLVHGTVQSMSPCGTNINGNVMVDQLFILLPWPPVPRSSQLDVIYEEKLGEFDFYAYLVIVYLINDNI